MLGVDANFDRVVVEGDVYIWHRGVPARVWGREGQGGGARALEAGARPEAADRREVDTTRGQSFTSRSHLRHSVLTALFVLLCVCSSQKFAARKARKFEEQGNRLALPTLEFAYIFLGIAHAPRSVILNSFLPQVDSVLAALRAHRDKPSGYEGGHGYWDDLCLAHFLEGICLRYIAYPDPDAVLEPGDDDKAGDGKAEAETRAAAAFQAVIADAANIQYDHYLLYYTRESLLSCVLVG